MAGLLVGGEVRDLASFASAGIVGAVLVFLGFAAASRCRPLSAGMNARRARLVVLSLGVGVALGVANLVANWMIAEADPMLRTLLVQRMMALEPRVALIASPITEEVAVRLFLMSGIAWVVFRFTKRAGLAFAVALVGSAFAFALLHLARPFPGDPMLSSYYRMALLTKYTMAGLPLGWLFWRWGLPYAVVCHIAANAAHLFLQNGVF
jgi:membrane protease YdiL (CAAX protease family)